MGNAVPCVETLTPVRAASPGRAERHWLQRFSEKQVDRPKIVRAFTSSWENFSFMFSVIHLDKKKLDEDGLFSHNFGYDFAYQA